MMSPTKIEDSISSCSSRLISARCDIRLAEEIPVREQADETVSIFSHGNVADLGKLHKGTHVLKGVRTSKRKHSAFVIRSLT